MLSEWCEQHNLKDVLLTRGEYHPYPMASEKETDTIVLRLITTCMPCLDGSGFVILEDQDNNKVKVEYNSFSLKAFSEYIAIDDARLKPIWGDHIYRILFKSKRPTSEAAWSMKITQA